MDSAISALIDPHRVQIVIPSDFELPADGVHGAGPIHRSHRNCASTNTRSMRRVNLPASIVSIAIVLDSARRAARHHHHRQGLSRCDAGAGRSRHRRSEAGRIGLRVYKLGMSWPLEPVATHEFARGLEDILVVEEKRSIVEDQLTSQLYNWPVEARPRVVGEFDEAGNDSAAEYRRADADTGGASDCCAYPPFVFRLDTDHRDHRKTPEISRRQRTQSGTARLLAR